MSPRCHAACTLAEPTAGAELAGWDTRRSGRPSTSGSLSAIQGQAPWFAGSSCTQISSAVGG